MARWAAYLEESFRRRSNGRVRGGFPPCRAQCTSSILLWSVVERSTCLRCLPANNRAQVGRESSEHALSSENRARTPQQSRRELSYHGIQTYLSRREHAVQGAGYNAVRRKARDNRQPGNRRASAPQQHAWRAPILENSYCHIWGCLTFLDYKTGRFSFDFFKRQMPPAICCPWAQGGPGLDTRYQSALCSARADKF